MKYQVKLSYIYFTFSTRDEALDFAELAVSAAEDELSVSVTVEPDPRQEPDQEEGKDENPEEVPA